MYMSSWYLQLKTYDLIITSNRCEIGLLFTRIIGAATNVSYLLGNIFESESQCSFHLMNWSTIISEPFGQLIIIVRLYSCYNKNWRPNQIDSTIICHDETFLAQLFFSIHGIQRYNIIYMKIMITKKLDGFKVDQKYGQFFTITGNQKVVSFSGSSCTLYFSLWTINDILAFLFKSLVAIIRLIVFSSSYHLIHWKIANAADNCLTIVEPKAYLQKSKLHREITENGKYFCWPLIWNPN